MKLAEFTHQADPSTSFAFLLVFAVIACHTSGDPSEAGPLASKRVTLILETAAVVGAALRSLVASGKLKVLRWPEFRDVSGDTLKILLQAAATDPPGLTEWGYRGSESCRFHFAKVGSGGFERRRL